MKKTMTIKEKVSQLMIVLTPILITQTATYAMSFFDIMMTGRYSASDLAGVAIGSSIWMPFQMGVGGILLAVTPIIGHLIGGGKSTKVRPYVIQTFYLGTIFAAVIWVAEWLFLESLLQKMDLEEDVKLVAKEYLISLSFGFVPFFVCTGLRGFIDALGKTNVSMNITLLALPINVLLNYAFIYGKFGIPEYGGIGAGIATALTHWLTFFITLLIIHKAKPFAGYKIFYSVPRADLRKWQEMISLGIPIGLTIFMENSIFSAVTLFMSQFGTIVIAAHQAALNFEYLLYMLPLSVSMAMTILIGFEAGAGRFKDARTYSYLGVGFAIMFTALCGIFLIIFRHPVAGLYSHDPEVMDLAAKFLLYAVFFQLSDAFQAPIQGVLRGYKDVKVSFFMSLGCYWIIGLPTGYALANHTEMGPFGYWLGLIIGLAVGALMLTFRLAHIQKKKENLQKRTRLAKTVNDV